MERTSFVNGDGSSCMDLLLPSPSPSSKAFKLAIFTVAETFRTHLLRSQLFLRLLSGVMMEKHG